MSLRSLFLTAAAAVLVVTVAAPAALAQSMVVTIDDGHFLRTTPQLSAQARNQALLDSLARHQVKAALFITAGFGADKPAGRPMASAWGDAGHAIGNHTMTHPSLNAPAVTLEQFRQEVRDCDQIIASLPGYQKWFRYPFMQEGNTPAKRHGARAALAGLGYLNAKVDMDTKDWEFDDQLVAALIAGNQSAVDAVKKAYLAHARARALALRDKVRAASGNARPQILLLHHNLLNALLLDEVLSTFKGQGWTFAAPTASDFSAFAPGSAAGTPAP